MANKTHSRAKTFPGCLLVVLWLLGASSVVQANPESGTPKAIRFGSVAMDTPAAMDKRLTPLTEYLSSTLKRPVILKLSPSMPDAIRQVSAGQVELAYLTPVAYLSAHQSGAQLIAKTVTAGKSSFRLMIVVADDSPIKTVADLEGKKFAFGDKAALLQRAVVVGAGMPLEKLGQYKFLGHYDNIVRGVLVGDYDAGILKDTMAYKWKSEGIRILYQSPELPPYNISASKNVDKALLMQLQKLFLDLKLSNPEHLAIIKALDNNYDGFAPTADAEYDVVRELVKPFQQGKAPKE